MYAADMATTLTAVSAIITSLAILLGAIGGFLAVLRRIAVVEKKADVIHDLVNSDKTAAMEVLLHTRQLLAEVRRDRGDPVPASELQAIAELENTLAVRKAQQTIIDQEHAKN